MITTGTPINWEREVFDYFTNYVLAQPADRLMWGAGPVVGHVDLFDPINSLIAKREQPNSDVSEEVKTLEQDLESQKQLLDTLVKEEVTSIQTIGEMLNK